jgi:hypothetical protein
MSAKAAGELQPGHGGKGVCLRSQISPELGQREWSGRHMPETGTVSPLRNGTWPDFCLGSFGGKIIFSMGVNPFQFHMGNKASGLPLWRLKVNK